MITQRKIDTLKHVLTYRRDMLRDHRQNKHIASSSAAALWVYLITPFCAVSLSVNKAVKSRVSVAEIYFVPLQLLNVAKRHLRDQIWNSTSYEIAFVFHYQSVHLTPLKLIHIWNKAELIETERGGEKEGKEISLQYMSELLQGRK